ncbi:MAG TPA: M64 family metallopeptidase, partial [Spirochaetota bacterium]|nr:M64 family metallopeptidase [Spirochaetota bacterium]
NLSPDEGYFTFDENYYYFGIKNPSKDYKKAETFRIYFDTDKNGSFNYDIDFSLVNGETHIYNINDKWDWNNNATHDINSGIKIGDGIECYLPKKLINFNPIDSFIGYEFITVDGDKKTNRTTYGYIGLKNAQVTIDGIKEKEWKDSDIMIKNFLPKSKKQNSTHVKTVYGKRYERDCYFAFDFYKPLNEYVSRIFFNIDTDKDNKNNYHISIDLINGAVYGFSPDNKEDYKNPLLLSSSKFSLTGDFLEILLPDNYFPQNNSVVTIGLEYKLNDTLFYDYSLVSFFDSSKIENVNNLKKSTPVIMVNNGDPVKKIDIVIVGDGYIQSEKAKFIETAEKMIKVFINNSTFNLFKEDFNFYYVFVASKESGYYDVKKGGKIPDTPFKAGLWQEGFYTCNDTMSLRYALDKMEDVDVVWLISNNDTNGAGTGSFINGLGGLSVSGSMGIETPIHETGHALFGLSDEYVNDFFAKTLKLEPKKENFKNMINVTVLDEIDFSSEESFKKSLKWGWIYEFPEFKNI